MTILLKTLYFRTKESQKNHLIKMATIYSEQNKSVQWSDKPNWRFFFREVLVEILGHIL